MSDAFEEQLEALSILDNLKKEIEANAAKREENSLANAQRARSDRGKLKSDLKKTTAFVKKIRALTPESLQQCIRDTETLNLTLYISEIVAALLEAKFKFNEVPGIVELCAHLHLRYDEFTAPLLSGLKESLLVFDRDGKRKRIQIRFLIELYQVGIFTEDSFFRQLIRFITGKPTKDSSVKANGAIDLSSLVTYVKYGAEILMGHTPRRYLTIAQQAGKSASDIPSKLIAPPAISNEIILQVSQATDKLAADLIASHADVRQRENKNEKDKIMHGSLSEQKQLEFENATRLYEKLLSSLTSLQEATGQNLLPELKEETSEDGGKSGISLHVGGGPVGDLSYGPYGDAESRAFYEDLPDLLALVPLSVLGVSQEQAVELREGWRQAKEKRAVDDVTVLDGEGGSVAVDKESDGTTGGGSVTVPAAVTTTASLVPNEDENGVNENDLMAYLFMPTSYSSKSLVKDQEDTSDSSDITADGDKPVQRAKIIVLLEETLPAMVTKENADEFSSSYCYVNTKRARKNLIAALSKLPRNRFELIPLYARVTASLARLYPDIVPPILDALHKDFFGMYKAKNQLHVESKLKNIRFIGELVKFRVAPPIMAFKMFQKLLADFHHHNVDLVATLLETCGRFLYLLPVTYARLERVLDTVMRHRRGRNMDLRQQQMLEAAYFMVKPPDRLVVQKKIYTEIQQYARHLIFAKLSSDTLEYVTKQLRKLPWYTPEENIEGVLVKAFMKMSRKKYTNVHLAAQCLSGIGKYYPNVIVRLVDNVFEQLTHGMSSSHKSEQQRLLTYVSLMGELYNCSALPSATIFDLLHFFLSHGYKDVGLLELFSAATTTTTTTEVATGATRFALSVPVTSSPTTLINALVSHYTIRYHELRPSNAVGNGPKLSDAQGDDSRSSQNNQMGRIDIDPPSNFFRIQMICELLNSCGVYFLRGMLRDKLDEFLLYFQRYLLSKPYLPSHIEFAVLDLYENLEQAAVDELRRSLRELQLKEKDKDKEWKQKKSTVVAESAEIKALKEKIAKPSSCFVRCSTFQEAENLIIACEEKKKEDEDKTRKRISTYYSKNVSADEKTGSKSSRGVTTGASVEDVGDVGDVKSDVEGIVDEDGEEEEEGEDDEEDEDEDEDDYRVSKKESSVDGDDVDDADKEDDENEDIDEDDDVDKGNK